MRVKSYTAALALTIGVTSAVGATCTSNATLSLGLGHDIAKSFSAAGSYVDCFTFTTVARGSGFSGWLSESDPLLNKLNIVSSVALYAGNTLLNLVKSVDFLNTQLFSFGSLAGGTTYRLEVTSNVTSDPRIIGTNRDVGYSGRIVTLAAAAPEPAAYALAIAGLAVVGAGVLRRRRS